MSGFVLALDYASVLVFALTGALVASRKQLDPVGFIFMAAMTAVGGGTVRDLVLGREVFWVSRPGFVLLAVAAAFLVFWTAHLVESRYRWLLWLDAMALSVAVPAGVGAALAGGFGPVIVVIAGVVTGSFGGLMRDVVGNEVPLVLKRGELYLTAAFGGALLALILTGLGMPRPAALIACGAGTFLLRAGSMLFGWSLPAYRPRPPRT
ncbi:MAG TPA: trimeric intracellular cation channel family protein [Paracoccus sp. (in: a-proteobacteria)]|nr:trimeric intracellular cation channel family protein [Paracoccus sp. (in: a-proteobacteria)]